MQCARVGGARGANDFGFQTPPLKLVCGYQVLKIQDYILKLHVLQRFQIIEHLLESHMPLPLRRLPGRRMTGSASTALSGGRCREDPEE